MDRWWPSLGLCELLLSPMMPHCATKESDKPVSICLLLRNVQFTYWWFKLKYTMHPHGRECTKPKHFQFEKPIFLIVLSVWYPYFGLLVMSTPNFEDMMDSLLYALALCNGFLRFTSANLLTMHFNLITYQIIMMKVGVEVTQGHIHLVCVHVLHFIFSLLCCRLHGVVFPFSLNRKKRPNMLATFEDFADSRYLF